MPTVPVSLEIESSLGHVEGWGEELRTKRGKKEKRKERGRNRQTDKRVPVLGESSRKQNSWPSSCNRHRWGAQLTKESP